MKCGHESNAQGHQPEKVHIPAALQIQIGKVLHGRTGEVEEIRIIGGKRPVDVQGKKDQNTKQPNVFSEAAQRSECRLTGKDQIKGEPHQPRMVYEALISGRREKICSVCWNQNGAEAAKCADYGDKARQKPLSASVFAEGQVQNDKNHQTAQMERQTARIQVHAALLTWEHVAHDLADLADRADSGHDAAGQLQAEMPADAQDRHGADKRGA